MYVVEVLNCPRAAQGYVSRCEAATIVKVRTLPNGQAFDCSQTPHTEAADEACRQNRMKHLAQPWRDHRLGENPREDRESQKEGKRSGRASGGVEERQADDEDDGPEQRIDGSAAEVHDAVDVA